MRVSIPFIGIFALHHFKMLLTRAYGKLGFQFPLLGFLLCILKNGYINSFNDLLFQFPLLGFLLCIPYVYLLLPWRCIVCCFNSLYWDFCFASYRRLNHRASICPSFQFPLLGFLLCIISLPLFFKLFPQKSFNSLYWDFCFASKVEEDYK